MTRQWSDITNEELGPSTRLCRAMPPRPSPCSEPDVAGAPRPVRAVLLRALSWNVGAGHVRPNSRAAVRRSVGALRSSEFGGV